MIKTRIAAALFACGALAASTNLAPAHADPANCQTVPWGFLGGQNRTICDSRLNANGSWMRNRIIWTRAHMVPITTSCSGGTYTSFCTSYGGGWQPYAETDNEVYPVTPDTVLPDEPGHLG